jgi:4'-phosphopantetheinyl transferase
MYKDKRYHFEAFDFNSDFNGVIAMEEKVAFNVEFVDLMDLLKE